MLARAGLRSTTSLIAKRGFNSSAIARSGHELPSGPYSNLPFKVHNRKIPYWAVHWTFFTVGIGAPFLIVYYNLVKQ